MSLIGFKRKLHTYIRPLLEAGKLLAPVPVSLLEMQLSVFIAIISLNPRNSLKYLAYTDARAVRT